jgi:hypothetical protein
LLSAGNVLRPADLLGECAVESGWVQVWSESGEMLALAEMKSDSEGLWLQPKRVFVGQS